MKTGIGKNLIKKGKELAFLLRHDMSYHFSKGGWRDVSDLTKNHGFSKTLLEEIVETDEKGRYQFDQTKNRIRAVQGHSVEVDMEYTEKEPPLELWHGTSSRFIGNIMKEGLKPMSRQYVHLSNDIETARKVGTRHGGDLVLLHIRAREAWIDGQKFYQAENGVWLTNSLSWKYIEQSYD